MSHPYQLFVRAHADRGGPCAVGIVVGQLHPEGGRPNLHALAPLVLDTTSVQEATLIGLLRGIERLAGKPRPIMLHTNDENVVGFLRGDRTPAARPELVAQVRAAMDGGTFVIHTGTARQCLCMGWAMQLAEAGNRSRRKAA